MPLFNNDRKRKEQELERDIRFKQGIGRVRRYVGQGLGARRLPYLHESFATLQELQGWREGCLQDGA